MSSTIVVDRRKPLTRLLALATALVLMMVTTPSVAPSGGAAAADLPVVAVEAVDAVVGGQLLEQAGCIGCVGVIVGVGGTTVIGTLAVLAAWPEFGVVCSLVCMDAYF